MNNAYISDIVKSKSGYNILFYDFPGCVSAGKLWKKL